MPSRIWSCSNPVGPGDSLGSARPIARVWEKSYITAGVSTYLVAAGKVPFRPFKSSDENVKHQNTRSFIRARKKHRRLSKNARATWLHVDSGLSRTLRRGNNDHRLSWVEKHLEITDKHMSEAERVSTEYGWSTGLFVEHSEHKQVTEHWFNKSQLCHKEGQRWGIIGHTIEPDINPMCPKGEQS